jgi:hypothetical protein
MFSYVFHNGFPLFGKRKRKIAPTSLKSKLVSVNHPNFGAVKPMREDSRRGSPAGD